MSRFILLICILILASCTTQAEERFPRPEFESGYVLKTVEHPEPPGQWKEYLDVALLFVALCAASWIALKKRSRAAMLLLSFVCLLYFGFYRQGCLCPVGSVQNVSFAVFNSGTTLPLITLAFFILPLIFALLFGRVFCAAVCPLGALQDLVAIKPLKLPQIVRSVVSFLPTIILVFAVLLAATGTTFIICRHDPFINIFRLTTVLTLLLPGIIMLLVGVFIARPYCSFFCPYGVLLALFSKISFRHVTIAPQECVRCRLCTESCPVDAIREPHDGKPEEDISAGKKRLALLLAATPLVMLALGWGVSLLSVPLSRLNDNVRLAERIAIENASGTDQTTVDSRALRRSRISPVELIAQAQTLREKLRLGGWAAGAVLGLFLMTRIISASVWRQRKDYEPDRGECVSCLRCVEYCPKEHEERKTDKSEDKKAEAE